MLKKILITFSLIVILFTGCGRNDDIKNGTSAYEKNDYKTALKYFKKACDAGVGDGCFIIATMYYNGKGVEKDKFKVVEFQEKACVAGDSRGCYVMGFRYQHGDYVRQSTEKALEYLGKACDMKHPNACEHYTKLKKSSDPLHYEF